MQVASLKMNLKLNLNSLLISDSNNIFSLRNATHAHYLNIPVSHLL